MNISVNGARLEVEATTLARLLEELDYAGGSVATAVNKSFVRRVDRETTPIAEGDEIEIVVPRQGG